MVSTNAQRMIEEFKAQLAREAREHQLRFESLRHKRAEAIETLYEKLVRARYTMERLVTSWEAKNAKEFQDAREEFWRLRLELALKRIYLPETLCEDLSNCIDLMWKPARNLDGYQLSFGHYVYNVGPPIEIERVDVAVRLEGRLAALLHDLAEHKRMTLTSCLEEILLHTCAPFGDGVASPILSARSATSRS
jgi:hypothetical protein